MGEDVQTVTSQLKGALTTLARMAMDLVWAHTGQNAHGEGNDGTLRFANGVLPEALHEPVTQIHAQANGLSKALEALGVDVKAMAKDDPSQAVLCAQLYAQAGRLAPRLGSVVSTAQPAAGAWRAAAGQMAAGRERTRLPDHDRPRLPHRAGRPAAPVFVEPGARRHRHQSRR